MATPGENRDQLIRDRVGGRRSVDGNSNALGQWLLGERFIDRSPQRGGRHERDRAAGRRAKLPHVGDRRRRGDAGRHRLRRFAREFGGEQFGVAPLGVDRAERRQFVQQEAALVRRQGGGVIVGQPPGEAGCNVGVLGGIFVE